MPHPISRELIGIVYTRPFFSYCREMTVSIALIVSQWSSFSAMLTAIALGMVVFLVFSYLKFSSTESKVEPKKPESVNYHFTRQCNYKCGFCFHTAKTSFVLPINEAKRGLKMLKDAGNMVASYIATRSRVYRLLVHA